MINVQKLPACSCIIVHIRKEGTSFPLNLPHPSSSYTHIQPTICLWTGSRLVRVVFPHFMVLRSNQPQTRDDEVWILSFVCIQRFLTRSFQHTHKSKNEPLTSKHRGKWMRQANEHATSFSHYVGVSIYTAPHATDVSHPHLHKQGDAPSEAPHAGAEQGRPAVLDSEGFSRCIWPMIMGFYPGRSCTWKPPISYQWFFVLYFIHPS